MSSLILQKNEYEQPGLARLTLNRAEKNNAFDDHMIAELTDTFKQIAADKSIRVLILDASGKHFCAGADLAWMQRMAAYSKAENLADANALAEMLNALYSLPCATVAQVQGAVYGGGVGLVAACDMAIGTRLSKFCLSEVKLGLIPATISPYVVDAIGARQAKRYFMSAEVISGRRARRLGLLNETVVEEELGQTVELLAKQILQNAPVAVTQAKHLVHSVKHQAITPELMAETSEMIADIRVSPEGQEGLQAFLNKRKPSWQKDD